MKPQAFASTTLLLTLGLALPLSAAELSQSSNQVALNPPLLLAQATWLAVSPAAGEFTIEMPMEPEESSMTMLYSGEALTWTIFKTQVGSEFYAVVYTDLTSRTLESGASVLLEALKANLLTTELEWTGVGDLGRAVALDGNPGLEYLSIQAGQITATRFYLVGQRLYGLFTRSENLSHVSQFFNSFDVDSNWRPFFSTEGRFAVQLPETPSQETESLQLGNTALAWTLFEARNLYADPDLFVVAYTDLPETEVGQSSEAVLERLSQTILVDNNLQDLESSGRPVYLDNHPGRAFLGQRDGRVVALQIYLVDQRIYTVFGRSEEVAKVDWFLNSFELR